LVDRSFYTAGIAAFDRALLLWPAFAMACYRRGLIRGRELSEYAAAIHDLDAATTLRPEWPDPYLQRGLFHRFQQHSAAALADLRRYVELAPPGFWRDEAERQIAQILLDGTTE
jgi:tetratricopeptide (TPR) repeat protein